MFYRTSRTINILSVNEYWLVKLQVGPLTGVHGIVSDLHAILTLTCTQARQKEIQIHITIK